MSPHELIVLGVIVAAVILFISEWIGVDLIALMIVAVLVLTCLLYTSPSPRDRTRSRMPSSA